MRGIVIFNGLNTEIIGKLMQEQIERIKAAWADHGRQFERYEFVYPVISRRAKGISLGINLNPDGNCNFDCPYCQVDRKTPVVLKKELTVSAIRQELQMAIAHWQLNQFRDSERFKGIPDHLLDLKDLCLSGDGEATTVAIFPEVCELMHEIQSTVTQAKTKLVLITNATQLHVEKVQKGLAILTQTNGEIWGKLDAGSEDYFKKMSRSRYTLDHIENNLTITAQKFPLRIQTMLCQFQNQLPSEQELQAYKERILRIAKQATHLLEVQLYTIVRSTATPDVTPVPGEFLEETAAWLRTDLNVPVNAYWEKGVVN